MDNLGSNKEKIIREKRNKVRSENIKIKNVIESVRIMKRSEDKVRVISKSKDKHSKSIWI
jgi:hypothetical protein